MTTRGGLTAWWPCVEYRFYPSQDVLCTLPTCSVSAPVCAEITAAQCQHKKFTHSTQAGMMSAGSAQLVRNKKRASAVSRSISVPQTARLAQATSYAQLSRASSNPLRHSTGSLQGVLSRSATAAADGATQQPSPTSSKV